MQNESAVSSTVFQLRFLGSPRIEGPNGALSGPAAQRHRLALLAALATAPRGVLPRDRLLGLLWPETPMGNARQLLNAATLSIRKALGEAALLTENEAMRLDTAVLRVDVVEFEQALKRQDAAAAVELYGGPFLDGLSLPDAVEFEQWQERERDRLSRLHLRALEQLAENAVANGDLAQSIHWWRERLAGSPTEGRVAQSLMQVLAAAGDRAGALQIAAVHGRLLEQELGIAPDAEVERLATRLREQPAPASPVPAPARTAVTRPAAPSAPPAVAESVPVASAPPRRPRWRGGFSLIAASLIVMASAAGWMLQRNRSSAATVPIVNSVAVLPFVDLSPGREQEHLAAGVAEGILNALANVPGLSVPARSSSFQFRGENVNLAEVAERLHVEAVLEGSVQLVGDRLRINAQLAHPRTGYQLFSKQYDGSAAQIFELQDRIAKAIIDELQIHLSAGTNPQLVRTATRNFGAYNLYLRALQASKTTSLDGLQSAVRYLEEAIRLDSAFAAAYAGLGDAYVALSDYGFASAEFALPRARASVARALELDPASAEAHTALGHIANEPGRWEEAEQSFRKAIQLRPSYAAAHMWLGNNLLVRGRTQEGLSEFQRAADLDPLSPGIAAGLSQAQSISGDLEAAASTARRATAMAPNYPWAHATLASVLAARGEFDEAISEATRAVELSNQHPTALATLGAVQARGGRTAPARAILSRLQGMQSNPGRAVAEALVHANLGEVDAAFALLTDSPSLNHAAREWLRINPIWKPLRDDARWPALLRSLGLEN